MFSESDLLPISALQHVLFCERQWALIHLEGLWAENRLTVEGRHLHERADATETEVRGNVRIARGLRVHSFRLGLAGKADVVEFHHLTRPEEALWQLNPSEGHAAADAGAMLPRAPGRWRPYPVEYKRGRPKREPVDEVQLCAQALCLEEMLGTPVEEGALYYGKTRRRLAVPLGDALRQQTEELAARVRELTAAGETPPAQYEKKCDRCSLYEQCQPKTVGAGKSARRYLTSMIRNSSGTEGSDR